jgi:hypothetical protein
MIGVKRSKRAIFDHIGARSTASDAMKSINVVSEYD